MTKPEEPKSYEELAVERAREWSEKQAIAAKNLADHQAMLAGMPDVKSAPVIGDPWSHPAVVCRCGETVFEVRRWVLVNGLKHRCELKCLGCDRVDTWGWAEGAWLSRR